MCIRDRLDTVWANVRSLDGTESVESSVDQVVVVISHSVLTVSYTHLRAHETTEQLVCRLLLEKQKNKKTKKNKK